jgi:hypothetical protein
LIGAPLKWIDAPQRLIRAPPILDAPLHVVKKLHVASKIEEPKISGCTPEIARFLSVFKNVVKKLHLGLNLYDAWYKFFNIPLNYSPPAAPMAALVNKNLSSYKSVKHMILHNPVKAPIKEIGESHTYEYHLLGSSLFH